MSLALRREDMRIRALRPPKAGVDPYTPLGVLVEEERTEDGMKHVLTVFLAGSECPFTCVFCDLWRHTLDGPTPRGALPGQLRLALDSLPPGGPRPRRIKLYNAGNFFDPRAVPPEDLPPIAELVAPFKAVTVEAHARLIDGRAGEFARRLQGGEGGRLEVAIGLETIHPGALPRLNKKMTLAEFDRAAERLATMGLDLRVFVLLGTPFISPEESVEWTVRSAAYARSRGARLVALVPVRGGNGALDRLAEGGEFVPPTLGHLEAALEACQGGEGGIVVADLWDVERLATCPACGPARIARLRRINRTGWFEPRVACGVCGDQ